MAEKTLKIFTMDELSVMTNGWEETIASGGIETVYRGRMRDGRYVCVKRLQADRRSEKWLLS